MKKPIWGFERLQGKDNRSITTLDGIGVFIFVEISFNVRIYNNKGKYFFIKIM